eukprot:3433836-Amphidinium_carterae.3
MANALVHECSMTVKDKAKPIPYLLPRSPQNLIGLSGGMGQQWACTTMRSDDFTGRHLTILFVSKSLPLNGEMLEAAAVLEGRLASARRGCEQATLLQGNQGYTPSSYPLRPYKDTNLA